jgi:CheY-like chemotaxis protein
MTKSIKILAVDDETFNLDIIESILQDEGYEIILAEDGLVALEVLTQHPDIALVITDRMMPRMNGLELVEKLHADPVFQNIPIIMQSASASKDQIDQGTKAGVNHYLAKPFDADTLVATVRKALESAHAN